MVVSKVQPETMIIELLNLSDIKTYTTFDGIPESEYVVLVRIGKSQSFYDVNRHLKEKTYDFLIHCLSNGGRSSLAAFTDAVTEVLEDLYWKENVNDLIISGGSVLPKINKHNGWTIDLSISLNE